MASIAKEGTYQGKPTLELKWKEDSPYPFSFGVGKAKLILASMDAIKAFVEKHKNDPKPERTQDAGAGGVSNTGPEGERTPEYVNREPVYE